MKSIVILLLVTILSVALAEPLKYRQNQQFRASARQTSAAELSEPTTEGSGNEEDDGSTAEQATKAREEQAYNPSGWRPSGQLLVLPIRENIESTPAVESSTLDDAQTTAETTATTEENPTTEPFVAKQTKLEVAEPKPKITAAYKKGPLKFSGELKVGASDESSETTETNDESKAATTEQPSGALETTSEPDSEAVENVEAKNAEGSQVGSNSKPTEPQPVAPPQGLPPAFFVQLPDGSLQRVIYLTPPSVAQPAVFPPVSQMPAPNVPFGQLVQPQNQPFAFNPIANPRIVTFSQQYQAY